MVSTITSSSPPAGYDQTRLETQRSCAASGDTALIRQLAPPPPVLATQLQPSPPPSLPHPSVATLGYFYQFTFHTLSLPRPLLPTLLASSSFLKCGQIQSENVPIMIG